MGNFFVLAVNIFEPEKHSLHLHFVLSYFLRDTEQRGGGWGRWATERAWEVCQWDGGAEITAPGRDTESVLWFEQPVRVLESCSRHSYEVCSYIFLLHEMKADDPVLPGMPCDIFISATLSSLLAINLPSFHVCFLPILGLGDSKRSNSLVLKQTPLGMWPTPRCAPPPGPFFSDSRRVCQSQEESRWFT